MTIRQTVYTTFLTGVGATINTAIGDATHPTLANNGERLGLVLQNESSGPIWVILDPRCLLADIDRPANVPKYSFTLASGGKYEMPTSLNKSDIWFAFTVADGRVIMNEYVPLLPFGGL